MTASQILNQWDPVSRVFVKAGAWMSLLRIAATGDEGLLRRDMATFGTVPMAATLRVWLKAEIIRMTEEFNGGGNCRPPRRHRRYFITEKGLSLLRLQPEPTKAPTA